MPKNRLPETTAGKLAGLTEDDLDFIADALRVASSSYRECIVLLTSRSVVSDTLVERFNVWRERADFLAEAIELRHDG